jgi:hypothetical protein
MVDVVLVGVKDAHPVAGLIRDTFILNKDVERDHWG